MRHYLLRLFLMILLGGGGFALMGQQTDISTAAFNPDWKWVEGLETQKALEEIDKIYWATLDEKQYVQTLNAIAYRMKRQREIQKDATGLLIDSLKLDAERLPQPAKSIVYSLIADEYRAYYRDVLSKSLNRSRTATVSDDFTTWDNSRLIEESLKYFKMSIEDEKILQQTPIDEYKGLRLIVPDMANQKPRLPTLYDLLVFQAIQVLYIELSDNVPMQTYTINHPDLFADTRTFVNYPLAVIDSLSIEYQIISFFQRALRFRLQQPDDALNRYALVSMDVERLRYIHLRGRYDNNDMLLEKALKELIDKYQAYPEKQYPMYALATLFNDQADKWRNNKTDEWRNKYVEAYSLCEQIAASGDSAMTVYAEQLQKEIKKPSVELWMHYLQYPETPMLVSVSYRNINTLYLYYYRLNDEEVLKQINQDWYNPYFLTNDKIIPTDLPFDTTNLFKIQAIDLLSQPDYQLYSTELKLDKLPKGAYYLLASDSPNLHSTEPSGKLTTGIRFQVTSLGVAVDKISKRLIDSRIQELEQEQEQDKGALQIYLTDSKTGKPIKNGKIAYYQGDTTSMMDLVGVYVTDRHGMATLWQEDKEKTIKLVATHKKDRFVFDSDFSRVSNYLREPEPEMAFFTDRSIYRPGQTVFYKAIFFGNRKLLTNKSARVFLYDVNSKKIASQELTTDEFGAINGSFVIPQGILNGNMRLHYEIEWDLPYYKNLKKTYYHYFNYPSIFRVEEYKRPTFEIVFPLVERNFHLNDSVSIEGKANALAGYAIDNARVAYRITREERHRYGFWWLPSSKLRSRQREITSGTAVTQSDGSFTIAFKAIADDRRNDDLIYYYTITADVTDVNGETRSAESTLKISNKPLLVGTAIPEKIISRDSLDFDLTTTNLNGSFTPAEVTVTLSKLQNPKRILRDRFWDVPDTFLIARPAFEKSFPFDAYGNETNLETYPIVRQIAEYQLHTAIDKKISLSALKQAKAGWYRLDIKARASDKDEAEEKLLFFQLLGTPDGKNSPITNMKDWLMIVKGQYEPGENMEFLVAGGYNKSYIYYEIILNGKVVEQKSIVTGTTSQRIVLPVKEEYRGGVDVNFVMIHHQRVYNRSVHIIVPYSNKQLDMAFTTFRDKLLPGEHEKWTLSVKNKQGEIEPAEMVATLYDASLDFFTPHSWVDIFRFHPLRYGYYENWRMPEGQLQRSSYLYRNEKIFRAFKPMFPTLSSYFPGIVNTISFPNNYIWVTAHASQPKEKIAGAVDSDETDENQMQEPTLSEITTRRNFNETAFFYPQLRTDANGEITVEFTIPESLTRWKMLGFAHTKDLKTGNITAELITRKQVAISANAPRFFREKDRIELSAKVNNITDDNLTGQAMLQLFDATNMQPVDAQIVRSPLTQAFTVKAGESAGLRWTLDIPEGLQTITYKVTAQAGDHTDGEEKTVPVLANTMLLTETMPFSVRGGMLKTFTFNRLKENTSPSLRNHRLTLEYTSNPAWYAIQAMPYMMEYPFDCSEQMFTRFYANTLALAITNSSPRIKQIFDLWRTLPEHKDALLSNLEKNQELKQALLEETPWVMQANSETERKKRVGLLFDLNRMGVEQQQTLNKLQKMQMGDGGFQWFKGFPSDRFITQHIIAGIGHLQALNALDSVYIKETKNMVYLGLDYLDKNILSDYEALLKMKNFDADRQHITPIHLGYLYACSFTAHLPEKQDKREAFDFYRAQAVRYWKNFNLYCQAATALALHRYGDTETATAIIRSLKGRARRSEEMGMYWPDNTSGYFWYQAPVETQAILIEAFNEIANDRESVEEMKIWLLRQKQTSDWRTTKATAEACFALLMTDDNLLDESQALDVKIGGSPLASVALEEIRPEPGSGYVKTSWSGSDIQKEMASLETSNPNPNGIAWGGLYWQYFEQLDKITSAETNLQISKQLFLRKNTERGAELIPLSEQNKLKVGDLVTVRMELRADRDYEYVHLKDMRASGLEPASVLSGHRFQDGLFYYESIKDAATNFFISRLPKGTYIFEYNLRATHVGEFSNGIATFQCMYAPEYNAHTESLRVVIEE